MPDTTTITSAPPITCSRCHKNLASLETGADATCPECGLEVFFTQPTADAPASTFRGWLPRKLGPYDINGFVAEGETGIVLRATHREKQTAAAITLLRDNANAEWRQRFESEVETLKKLKHPNVLSPLDHGQEREMLWLAVEWVEGQSLATRIARANENNEEIPLIEIQETMLRVRDGLEYLHTNSLLHRDLKPANVLIGKDRSVKIVHLGAGTGGGAYVAPELLEFKPASTSSDVYCFGLVWYEMLTGKPRVDSPQTPVQVRPETPTVWNNAILKCLGPIPANRIRLNNLKSILSERPAGAAVRKKKVAKRADGTKSSRRPLKLAVCVGAVALTIVGAWRAQALIHRAWDSTHTAKAAPVVVREEHAVAPIVKEAVADATPPVEEKTPTETKTPTGVKATAEVEPKAEVKAPAENTPLVQAKPATDVKEMNYADLLDKAKAEDLAAMTELGQRYQQGTGGARNDPQMARKWLRAAATRGHFPAMLALANAQRDIAEDESLEMSDRTTAAREAELWYGKLTTTVGVPSANYLAALLGARQLHKHFGPEVFTADTTDTSTEIEH